MCAEDPCPGSLGTDPDAHYSQAPGAATEIHRLVWLAVDPRVDAAALEVDPDVGTRVAEWRWDVLLSTIAECHGAVIR